VGAFTLEDLAAVVAARSASSAEKSYTKSLLQGGPAKTAQKFGEEAVELVIAAMGQDQTATIGEAADVLYHLMVLLRSRGVSFEAVLAELERRSGRSGHDEKAARSGERELG